MEWVDRVNSTFQKKAVLYGTISVVIIIITALIVLGLSASEYRENSVRTGVPTVVPTSPFPTRDFSAFPTPVPEEGDLLISGIAVNDFTQDAYKILPNGDVIIKESSQYQIVYIERFESFIVSITNPDIARAQSMAERDLLAILGIDEPNACRLTVQVGIPGYVSEKYGGQSYPLSFCDPSAL